MSTSPAKYRVWWHEEFKACRTDEERDDLAWAVPDRRGLLYPEVRTPCDDVEDAARQYDEHFHDERDGHECTWPLQFVVHDGATHHLVSVDRDYEPVFRCATPRRLEAACVRVLKHAEDGRP